MSTRPARSESLRILLQRLDSDVTPAQLQARVGEPQSAGRRVALLFADNRRGLTLLLWMMNLGNVALVYFFFSWLPSLMAAIGLNSALALRTTALFSASGVLGSLAMVAMQSRFGAMRVLIGAYLIAILASGALIANLGTGALFLTTIVLAGASTVGSQFCLSAVVAQAYPVPIRATASGFAVGIGRAGAVLTPLAAGALIGVVGGSRHAFIIALAPATIALAAALLLQARERRSDDGVPPQVLAT